MKKAFACILLISCAAIGQDFRKSGTSGFTFLQIPVSARYAALGDAGITLPDVGADGLFINPALAGLGNARISLSASYADWYVDTRHTAAGLAYQIGTVGTVGLSVVHFDFGEVARTANFIPGVLEPGENDVLPFADQGTYTAGAYAFGLSFARRLTEQFSFGATVKYVLESIDSHEADNVIADIGFLYFTGFRSLRVGAFLQNFGLETQYETDKFKMPQQLRLEISGEVWGSLDAPNRLTLIADAAQPNDADERLQFGAEATLLNSLVLRGGYKFGYDAEDLTLGMGLRFFWQQKKIGVDLSYMSHDQLENALRTTLTLEL